MSLFEIPISLLLAVIYSQQSLVKAPTSSTNKPLFSSTPLSEFDSRITTSIISEEGLDVPKRHLLSIPSDFESEEETNDETTHPESVEEEKFSEGLPVSDFEDDVFENPELEVAEEENIENTKSTLESEPELDSTSLKEDEKNSIEKEKQDEDKNDEEQNEDLEVSIPQESRESEATSNLQENSSELSPESKVDSSNEETASIENTLENYEESETESVLEFIDSNSTSESETSYESDSDNSDYPDYSNEDEDEDDGTILKDLYLEEDEDDYLLTNTPFPEFEDRDLPFPPSPPSFSSPSSLLYHRKESLKLVSDLFITFLTSYLPSELYTESTISSYSHLYLEERISSILSLYSHYNHSSEDSRVLEGLEKYLSSHYKDVLPVYYFSDIRRKVYGDYSDYPYVHLFDENVFRNPEVFSFFSKVASDFLNNTALETDVYSKIIHIVKGSFEDSGEEGKKLVFEIFSEFYEDKKKNEREYEFEEHGDFLFESFLKFLNDKEEVLSKLLESLRTASSELKKETEGVLSDVEDNTSVMVIHYKPEGVIPELIKGSLHYSLYELGMALSEDFWKLDEGDFEYGLVNFRAERAEKFLREVLRLDEEIKIINENRVTELASVMCRGFLKEKLGWGKEGLGIFRMLNIKCNEDE